MSLKTKSFFKKDNVPSDTLTGIRINRATTVIGTNIFKLPGKNERVCSEKMCTAYEVSNKGYLLYNRIKETLDEKNDQKISNVNLRSSKEESDHQHDIYRCHVIQGNRIENTIYEQA